MQEFHSPQNQSHPLHGIDRENIDRLLAKDSPANEDLVDLARLLIRYKDFPGAHDLKTDMDKAMKHWGLSRDSLNEKARSLWNKGYRPGGETAKEIGDVLEIEEVLRRIHRHVQQFNSIAAAMGGVSGVALKGNPNLTYMHRGTPRFPSPSL